MVSDSVHSKMAAGGFFFSLLASTSLFPSLHLILYVPIFSIKMIKIKLAGNSFGTFIREFTRYLNPLWNCHAFVSSRRIKSSFHKFLLHRKSGNTCTRCYRFFDKNLRKINVSHLDANQSVIKSLTRSTFLWRNFKQNKRGNSIS